MQLDQKDRPTQCWQTQSSGGQCLRGGWRKLWWTLSVLCQPSYTNQEVRLCCLPLRLPLEEKSLPFPSVSPHWKEDFTISFCDSPLGRRLPFSLSLKLWVPWHGGASANIIQTLRSSLTQDSSAPPCSKCFISLIFCVLHSNSHPQSEDNTLVAYHT